MKRKQHKKKELEQAVQIFGTENDQKYKAIFDYSPLAIMCADANGVITACNDNASELFSAPKEKLVGFSYESFRDEGMRMAIVKALSGRKSRFEGEYLTVTGNVSTHMNANFSPVFNPDGSVGGVIGIFEDITGRENLIKNTFRADDQVRQNPDRPLLEIKTLGGFSVTRGDRNETIFWNRPITQKLFKVVLCNDGRILAEPLMETIWPESTLDKQRSNFKVALHRLRRILEPDMIKNCGSSYLKLTGNELQLNPALCRMDADLFEELCGKADQAGDDETARQLCKEAVDLYQGDFLANDIYETWIEPKRRRLRNRWYRAARRLSDLYAQSGNMEKALDVCERIIEADPADETAYRDIMRIYARQGLTQSVHRIYQQCKTALRDEIDIAPSPETTAIYKTLLNTMRNPSPAGRSHTGNRPVTGSVYNGSSLY